MEHDENSESKYLAKNMEKIRKQAAKSKSLDFIDDDKLQSFQDYLRELKENFLEKEQYIKARDASELIERCKTEMQIRAKVASKCSEHEAKKSATDQMVTKYDQKIHEHDERTQDKLSELHEKHKNEMEAFETEWKEDMPDKYRRPSQRLIELRKSAHNLALCGEFNEAQDLKNEAENLERKETEEAQRRLNKEYTIAKNRLIRKQKEEIRIFQENAEQQRIVLLSKRQIAEQASNNRKNVLNSKPSPKSRNSPQSKGSPTRLLGTRRSPSRSADRKLPPLIPPKEDTQKIKENSRKMEREIHSKKYREIHIEQDPYVHESESMSSRSD